MSNFKSAANAVRHQFTALAKKDTLFVADVSGDELWDLYLASFPPGTNPMYRERTENDCGACKQFIRALGNVVHLDDSLRTHSIWEVPDTTPEPYRTVFQVLHDKVSRYPIAHPFRHPFRTAGIEKNYEQHADGRTLTWHHFFAEIPSKFVASNDRIGPFLAEARSSYDVFLRGLTELRLEDIDTVLELITQKSLYRGDEFKRALQGFRTLKDAFNNTEGHNERTLLPWKFLSDPKYQPLARFRNTVIGTLLVDLAEGKDLDAAVAAYESKVAPTNYKRPTALVTKGMIEKAQQTIEALQLQNSLGRRYAVADDLTINNVLFADRQARQTLAATGTDAVLADMLAESGAKSKPKNLSKVETVSIDTFLKDILPQASTVELFLDNRHQNNLVSLIAPTDPAATPLFKWPNGFSWSYNGEVTDSIKERVKRAGGNIQADLRCSLSWNNTDDLDLHMKEPTGPDIYYGRKHSSTTGGRLDVDMNASTPIVCDAVENICYPDRTRMVEGVYTLKVHNFNKRESKNVGFEVEIEFDGHIHSIKYDRPIQYAQTIDVATLSYTRKDGLKIIKSLPSTEISRTYWNLPTQQFHRVSLVLNSPNHWDNHAVGNKHVFFILDGCKNDAPTRGFYNEFLRSDLETHRKVFEVLGNKLQVPKSDHQLSGIGFSTTQRNEVLVRVSGSFNRMLKVTF